MENNINKNLKLLKSGDIHLIDVDAMTLEFKKKQSLGDLLQYELHNYCKENMKKDENVMKIVKLASLCYSKESILHFTSMDRFVGCVYFICCYLLKNEKYKEALIIACSLNFKKESIILTMKSTKDIFNFLCTLHSCFMSAATELASCSENNTELLLKYSHELAIMSLKLFLYNNLEQSGMAKKILKKSKLYLYELKYFKAEDIKTFNELLKSILKVMIPKFCHLDYCIYFLHKIKHMQNVDYSKGVELFQQVEKITQIILILCDFSTEIKDALENLLNFFFNSQPLKSNLPSFKLIENDIKTDEQNKILLFLILSNIFHYGIQYWWKLFEDDWSAKVSTEMLHGLFTEMLELHKVHYKNVKLYCNSCKNLCETCFADLLMGNLQKIQYTIRQCLKNKIPLSITLVPLARDAFKLSLECINKMKTMGCCKMQRSYAWKYAIIHHTNLVEDILRQPPSKEVWNQLADCSQELLNEIVNSEFELPYDSKRINILFQRWHQSVLKQQKFYDALFVCAVFYASYPEYESDIISMWLQTKSECENEIFQEMTVLEVLKKFESAVREFNPKLKKNVIKAKSILLMELKAYGSCTDETFKDSKTLYNLVSRIWKKLERLDLDLWETSFACTCLIAANIAGERQKLPKNFVEKCEDIVVELTNWKFEGKLQCRSLVHAASLRFSLFLYNLKSIENNENVEDANELVLNYLRKAEEEKIKLGEDIDLNLTCNVIPASSHLTVELENDYLNSLKQIVDLWNNALENGLDQLPTQAEFQFWLQNVQLVAYLYDLYGEYHLSLSTWLLFYRISKLCGDSAAVLLGLCHILKNFSDVEKADLFKESDDISLQLAEKNLNKETLVAYWLMVASSHLKNKRPLKCIENLKASRKVLESLKITPKIHALHSKLWCLISQFLTYYPEHEEEFGYETNTDLRVIVFKAFNYAVAGARNHLFKSVTQLECTELVLTMLEVNIWAFHFHEIYLQTDFMRFFLDDLYQIVQKLFLPTRTAEILLRLAEVDLICEKLSDCQEKVTKLKSILSISHCSTDSSSICKESKPPCEVQECNKSFYRTVSPTRFLPTPVNSSQTAEISPIHLHLVNANKSDAIKHKVKCKCRLCQNFLIQILTMTTYSLEAEILRMENRGKQGFIFYKEALNVLNKIEHLRTEKTETLRLEMSTPLKSHLACLDFQARSVQFYAARFLIKYAFFESSVTNTITENAKNGMEKITRLLKKLTYEQKLLMWRLAELKLLWLVFVKGEPKRIEKDSPKEFKTIGIMKTPCISRSGVATSTKKKVIKDLNKEYAAKTPYSAGILDEACEQVAKNTSVLNSVNVPNEKKLFVQPRKLRFKTNEPLTLNNTVKKTSLTRPKDFKPKKLNLDCAD